MIDSPLMPVHLILSVIGLLVAAESGSLLAVGAVTVVALTAAVLVSVTAVRTGGAAMRLRTPRRSIDVSVLVSQSDPDAPGRSRPRAPGLAARAA